MTTIHWAGILLLIAVTLAVVVTRRRRNAESARSRPHGATDENAEDERATRMQVDLVLREKGRTVVQDTLIFTEHTQEKSYKDSSSGDASTYVIRYQFGRPTCSLEVKCPAYEAAVAMPPYRTSGWDSIDLVPDLASLILKRRPLT